MKHLDLTSMTWKQLVQLKQAVFKFETIFKNESSLTLVKNLREFTDTMGMLEKSLYFPDDNKSVDVKSAFVTEIGSITNTANDIVDRVKNLCNDLALTRVAVESRIHELIKLKQVAYETEMFNKAPFISQYFLKILSTPSIISQYKSLISMYTDFRHPALLVTPADGTLINDCVGFDPLYILSSNKFDRESIEKMFNEKFLNRLRIYDAPTMKVWPEHIKFMSVFPTAQFSMIVPFATMTTIPYSGVASFILEIKRLLRPGGVCVFAYVNIETITSMYTGGNNEAADEVGILFNHLLYDDYDNMLKNAGLKVLHHVTLDTCSIVVAQNPGQLTTIKASQALGEIKERNY